jgi:hypothetical protein
VAGKGPPPAVQALAEPARRSGHVDVAGFVPDAGPLLQQARAFIVPVRAGGGMRVKIVDGWQWALPVISTTIGAEGIQTRDGENILLADSPQEFAAAVLRVLADDAAGGVAAGERAALGGDALQLAHRLPGEDRSGVCPAGAQLGAGGSQIALNSPFHCRG